jgi:hypothetical protein
MLGSLHSHVKSDDLSYNEVLSLIYATNYRLSTDFTALAASAGQVSCLSTRFVSYTGQKITSIGLSHRAH